MNTIKIFNKQEILKAVKKTKNSYQKKKYFLIIPKIVKRIYLYKNYNLSLLTCFAVKEPKIREIFAPAYVDRVLHHLIIGKIEKEIDQKLIFDCYSNRKNKSTHLAIKKLQRNIKSINNNYYLKGDIKSFFASINKEILCKILLKHIYSLKNLNIYEKNILFNILKKIILQNPINPLPIFTGDKKLLTLVPKEKSLFYSNNDKGLPIGSLTSQFFANLYLNELDQFIKHRLKIRYYIRYVDDFIILTKNKEALLMFKKEIQSFLYNNLKLTLHPNKIIIQHKSKGVDFLGYIVKKDYLLIRKRTIKSFKRKLYFFNHLIRPDIFSISDPPSKLKLSKLYLKKEIIPPININLAILQKMLAVINSYYGLFSFANTYNLRRKLYHKNFHYLKKYFIPQNNYKSVKINPAFLSRRGSHFK